MRDPKRLDGFYDDMRRLHKRYFPDWRFGQLMSNFLGWVMGEKKRDIFFPEEEEMMQLFIEFTEQYSPFAEQDADVRVD